MTAARSGPAAPLEGVLVVDLSRVLAGPLCAQRLADLGARCIKVEPPGGDPTRAFGPPFRDGESPYFMACNRGKEDVVLDLRREAGREVVERLLARADVVIENFRPGALERLGLGDARIAALAPDAVRVTITGWGSDSERADDPAFDLAVQAESGLMAMTGEADGAPCRVPFSASDAAAGLAAAEAALAALFARARGRPFARRIEVSLIDATLAATGYQAQGTLMGEGDPARLGHAHPNLVPYQLVRTADGGLVLAVATDAQWRRLVGCDPRLAPLDRPEWARNADRVAARVPLVAALEEALSARSSADWASLFHAADVPVGELRGLGAALDLARARPRGPVVRLEHARLGAMEAVGGAAVFDGVRATATAAAPTLDQHGEVLLAELAGSPEELARWRRALGRDEAC